MDYDALLAKLSPKDRLNVERHITAVEEQLTKAHAALWRRLAVTAMNLAGHTAKSNGQQSMQFYAADGKYRMQIFAIEDLRDGKITVIAPDAMDEAIRAKVVGKPKAGETNYPLPSGKSSLAIERLDGKDPNLPMFYKDMLGWNRRAIRITVPADANATEAAAIETLMSLGAKKALPKAASAT